MSALFLLIRSNLKARKVQSAAIAVVMLLSSLLVTAAALLDGSEGFYRDIHARVNGSHTLLLFENGLYDAKAVHAWWSRQDGVEAGNLFRHVVLTQFVRGGEEISNLTLYMTNAGDHPLSSPVDRLIFAERRYPAPTPEAGTIWIPTSLAHSKSIKVGDRLLFKGPGADMNLRVSAIVVDVPFSQPFSVTYRIWMNPSDYAGHVHGEEGREKALMGLRFRDETAERKLWERFRDHFGAPFLDTILNGNALTSFYFMVGNVLGVLMVIMACIMLAIALYAVGYTIADAILSARRTIGICQALGMPGARIATAFVLQYVLIALLAAVPGAFAGHAGAEAILGLSMAYLRTSEFPVDIPMARYAALSVGIIAGLTAFMAWLFSYEARRIEPVQAIRYGTAENRVRRTGSLSGITVRLPAEGILCVKRMRSNMKAVVFASLVSALATAALASGATRLSGIHHLQPPKWGYDDTDIVLEAVNGSPASVREIGRTLAEHPGTDHVGRAGAVYGVPAELPDTSGPVGIPVTFVEGDFDKLGFETVRGRNPVAGGEIALGIRAAELLGKEVGDNVDFYFQGRKASFTVTGIYQAIANRSVSACMAFAGVERLNLDREPSASLFYVKLKEGASAESFMADMRRRFGQTVYVASQEALIREAFLQAVRVLVWPLAAMGLFILGIAFGIAYGVNRLQIKRDARTFGIYRVIGMTVGRLRLAIVSGTALPAFVGALSGIFAGALLFPGLLGILQPYGIEDFPVHWRPGMLAAVAAAGWAAVVLGSWPATAGIRRESVRLLAEEA